MWESISFPRHWSIPLWAARCPHCSSRAARSTSWTSGGTAPLIWNICASFCERTRCSSPSARWTAPHKFYGLNGSGLLVKKKNLVIEPQIHGGGSTTPYRSGTPALGMAMSIEKALRLALENQNERIEHVAALNRLLRAELAKYPKVRFNSPENAVPHILNLSVNGVKGTAFQQELGKNDVCVSVKSTCSVEGTPSKAVYAVSRDRKNALSSWRISLSHLTTEAEIAEFLQIFDRCYRELAQ